MIIILQILVKYSQSKKKKFYDIHIISTIKNISKSDIIEVEEKSNDKSKLIDNNENEIINDNNAVNLDENNDEKKFNNILNIITNYIKKKFGEYDGENIMNNNDKILLKIFIINLVCKDLTYELCEKSQNIWDFFLNLARHYNEAIEGLKKLSDNFK